MAAFPEAGIITDGRHNRDFERPGPCLPGGRAIPDTPPGAKSGGRRRASHSRFAAWRGLFAVGRRIDRPEHGRGDPGRLFSLAALARGRTRTYLGGVAYRGAP